MYVILFLGTHMTVKNLKRNILKLPPLERIHLIESLIASLDKPDAAIERAWAAESDKRLAGFKKGSIKSIPLENVKKRLSK